MKAFISYSHHDSHLLDKLHEHLSALRREGLLETWTDREIHAGGEIDEEVADAMEESELFLLLISASFLNSNYCFEREFKRAQEKRDAKTAIIVPLILKEVDWEIPALRKYKALPDDGKPVISRHWHSDDEGFANIAKGLRKMLRAYTITPAKKPAAKKAANKTKFRPNDTHITIEQKELLKKLQEEVVDRLTAKLSSLPDEEYKKRRGKWFAIVWSQFNEHFETTDGLPSLPKDQFDAAKSWLLQYRASKDKNFKRVDPQKYRNTLTKAIYSTAGALGWSKERVYEFAADKLEQATPITSLNDLGNQQLEVIKGKITYENTKRTVKSKQAKAVKKPRISVPKLDFSKELLEAIFEHPNPEERGLTEILSSSPSGPLNVHFIPNITGAGGAPAAKKSVFKPAVAELLSLGWLLQPEGNSDVRMYELNPHAPCYKR